jgi:hypothetical protein
MINLNRGSDDRFQPGLSKPGGICKILYINELTS